MIVKYFCSVTLNSLVLYPKEVTKIVAPGSVESEKPPSRADCSAPTCDPFICREAPTMAVPKLSCITPFNFNCCADATFPVRNRMTSINVAYPMPQGLYIACIISYICAQYDSL